jgi:hypothetical protein
MTPVLRCEGVCGDRDGLVLGDGVELAVDIGGDGGGSVVCGGYGGAAGSVGGEVRVEE